MNLRRLGGGTWGRGWDLDRPQGLKSAGRGSVIAPAYALGGRTSGDALSVFVRSHDVAVYIRLPLKKESLHLLRLVARVPFCHFVFLSFKISGVTTSPSLKNLSKSARLIVAYLVSKFLLLNPLIGILL